MKTSYFNRTEAGYIAEPEAIDKSKKLATEDLILSVCSFDSETDKVPQQHNRTWADLCRRLSKSQPRNKKTGAQTWSPTQYILGARRSNEGVESISCAVIDVEHHGSFESIKERLNGHAYLAHSSYRHTIDDPRFRIVLPLTTPSLAEQWPMHWERINHWLGEINDPATSDLARVYFIPCHPAGGQPFHVVGHGRPLDIKELPELPEGFVVQKVRESAARSISSCIKIEGIEESPPEPLNPEKGLNEIVERCVFMQIVSNADNQNDVTEPIWSAMISNACRFENSNRWIHHASCQHDGYDEEITDNRIERFRNNYAPTTCQKIRSRGFRQCPGNGCCLPSGEPTKAPAGLWVWLLKKPIVLPSDLMA